MTNYTLHHGNCLDILPTLSPSSVDAVIADPPYGTTACKWDSVIPFEAMWRELKRVIKPRGAIVLFGSQPFTSALIMSNVGMFKYQWVWEKTRAFDLFNAKNKPLEKHEDICIFSDGTTANRSPRRMIYNPQGLVRVDRQWKRPRKYETEHRATRPSHKLERVLEFTGYPDSVLHFSNPNYKALHPTQKPLALLEYLVRTYTHEGDTVLDFTFGSGTTGEACINTGRDFIGIEKERNYYDIAECRLAAAAARLIQMEIAI